MYVNQVFMSCDRLLLMAGIYLLHQTFFDRLLLWEDGAELCGHGKPSPWPEEFETLDSVSLVLSMSISLVYCHFHASLHGNFFQDNITEM